MELQITLIFACFGHICNVPFPLDEVILVNHFPVSRCFFEHFLSLPRNLWDRGRSWAVPAGADLGSAWGNLATYPPNHIKSPQIAGINMYKYAYLYHSQMGGKNGIVSKKPHDIIVVVCDLGSPKSQNHSIFITSWMVFSLFFSVRLMGPMMTTMLLISGSHSSGAAFSAGTRLCVRCPVVWTAP